jgi:hypothetical protein
MLSTNDAAGTAAHEQRREMRMAKAAVQTK